MNMAVERKILTGMSEPVLDMLAGRRDQQEPERVKAIGRDPPNVDPSP